MALSLREQLNRTGGSNDLGLTTKKFNQISITISMAERAILEYLYDVSKQEGFDEASHIMESLASLRPKMLQEFIGGLQIHIRKVPVYVSCRKL